MTELIGLILVAGVIGYGVYEIKKSIERAGTLIESELSEFRDSIATAIEALSRSIDNAALPFPLIAQTLKEMRRGEVVSLAEAEKELERIKCDAKAARDELEQIYKQTGDARLSHQAVTEGLEAEHLANIERFRAEAERERAQARKLVDDELASGDVQIAEKLREIESFQQQIDEIEASAKVAHDSHQAELAKLVVEKGDILAGIKAEIETERRTGRQALVDELVRIDTTLTDKNSERERLDEQVGQLRNEVASLQLSLTRLNATRTMHEKEISILLKGIRAGAVRQELGEMDITNIIRMVG